MIRLPYICAPLMFRGHIGLGDQVGALMVGGLGTAGSLASRVPIYVLDGGRR